MFNEKLRIGKEILNMLWMTYLYAQFMKLELHLTSIIFFFQAQLDLQHIN